MSRAKTAMEELRKKYGSPSVKDEDEQKRTPQTQATKPASGGETKSRAKTAMEELRKKYESNPKAWTPTQTPNTTSQNNTTTTQPKTSYLETARNATQANISTGTGTLSDIDRESRRKELQAELDDLNSQASLNRKKMVGYQRGNVSNLLKEAERESAEIANRISEVNKQLEWLDKPETISYNDQLSDDLAAAQDRQRKAQSAVSKYSGEAGGRALAALSKEEREALYQELNEANAAASALSREQDQIGYLNDYQDKVYDDTFTGQFGANYRQGRIVQDTNAAFAEYIANPTEANKNYAYALQELEEQFRTNNQSALDDEGAVLPWVTQSAAGYIPQLWDQTKTTVAGGVVGGLVGAAVGQPVKGAGVGITLARGEQSYNQMKGAAYRALIAEGMDEASALEAAQDEAFISALLEMGDTAFTLLTLGAGKAASILGNAAIKSGSKNAVIKGIAGIFGKGAANKAAKDAAKWAGMNLGQKAMRVGGGVLLNAGQEYAEEWAQEMVSSANQSRDGTGKWDLVGETVGLSKDALTGKNDEALSRAHEAGTEGFKIGLMFGGTMGTFNAAVSSWANAKTTAQQEQIVDEVMQDRELVESLIDGSMDMGAGTVSEKLAIEMRDKLAANEGVTRQDVAQLLAANEAYVRAGGMDNVAQSIEQAAREAVGAEAQSPDAPQDVLDVLERDDTQPHPEEVALKTAQNTKQSVPYNVMATDSPARQAHLSLEKMAGYGENGAKTFASIVESSNADPGKVRMEFQSAYEAGLTNLPRERASLLSGVQEEAYNAGRMDYIMQMGKYKDKRFRISKESGFERTNLPADVTEHQWSAVNMLAKAAGVKVRIATGLKGNAEIAEDGTVLIDRDFQREVKGKKRSIVFYAAHEIGMHRLMQLAPEEGRAFINAVVQDKNAGLAYGQNTVTERRQAAYAQQGVELSTVKAMEEVAADSILDLYENEADFIAAVERIINGTDEKAKKGARTFKDILNDLVRKLKSAVARLTGKEQAEAKQTLAEVEELRNLYETALKAATDKVKTGKSANNTGRTETDRGTISHHLKEVGVYAQEGRTENRRAFLERSNRSARKSGEVGEIAYSYVPVGEGDTSYAAEETAKELSSLGISFFYHAGLEYNVGGKTYTDNGYAAAIADVTVAILRNAYGDGRDIAGHEAYHIWGTTDSRERYTAVLRQNIDILTPYALEQADIVADGYFEGTAINKADFVEEYFARLSGQIHSGKHDADLSTMFKDYAAVKSAWDELVAENGKQHSLKDSEGRELSKGQQDYFRDSTARDEDGNLLTLYHGTRKGGFTTFRDWAYLTASKGYAKRYADHDTGDTVYEVYANITKPFDTRLKECRDLWHKEFFGSYSRTELQESGLPDWTDGYDLAEWIEENDYDYDGILLDEGADFDHKGEVKERGISYVVRSSEQIKNVTNKQPTDDRDIRFSLKSARESDNNLIAMHNLSAEKLKGALDLGGFPMPSIAVVKNDAGHEEFGDISVLFRKDTIDPQFMRRNKLYGADAWTPTRPSVGYKVNEKVRQRIMAKVEELLGGKDLIRAYQLMLDDTNVDDSMNRFDGDFKRAYSRNEALKIAYLKAKGIPFKPVLKEHKFNGTLSNDALRNIVQEAGLTNIVDAQRRSSGAVMQFEPIVRKHYNEQMEKDFGGTRFLDKMLVDEVPWAKVVNILRDAVTFFKRGAMKVVDETATRDKLEKRFTKKVNAEYEAWLDELSAGIIEKKGLRNSKDMFTSSGNRRSFEQLYMEYNLDNIVNAMAGESEKGGGVLGTGNIFGAATKEYGSISEMKADADRLVVEDEETHNAAHDEFVARFGEITAKMVKPNDSGFGATLDAGDAAVDALLRGKTVSGILRELKTWRRFNATQQIAQDIYDLARDISEAPTAYFEAKPRRAVGFDEVAAVVMPRKGSVELKSMLEERGVQVLTYNPAKDGDRLKKINSVDNISFSLKEHNDLMRENSKLKEVNENLREQFKATTFAKVDRKSLDAFTKKLLKDYSSGADIDETRDALDELYTYLANGEDGMTPSWSEAYKRAYETAVGILEASSALDDEMYRQYKDLRDRLRTTRISISPEHGSDLMGYENLQDFRRRNMGRLNITKDGIPVDVAYAELAGLYPELFDEYTYSTQGDQLVHIADVLESMQPMEINPYSLNMRENATWLANDIMERFFELPQAKPTFADKAQRKLTNQAIKDAKKLERVREQKNERIRELIAGNREKVKQVQVKERDKRLKAVQEIKEHYKAKEGKASESRKAREMRAKILRHTTELSKKLLRANDKNHIPQELQGVVAKLLECINLESNYTYDAQTDGYKKNDLGSPTLRTKLFASLRKMYAEMADELTVDPDLLGDDGLLSDVVELADKRMADMNLSELETIWKAIRAIEASIQSANIAFTQSRLETISEAAEALRMDNIAKKDKVELDGPFGFLGKAQKLTGIEMMTPEAFFHRLGKSGDNLFRLMRDAQDDHIRKMKAVSDFTHEKLNNVNVRKLESKMHTVKLGGQEVQLSTAQIMELYVLMRREQAREHIMIGGILPDVVSQGKLKKIARAKPIRGVEMSQLLDAFGLLTEEEKRLAETLQEYASTQLSAWGNEAAMRVYNYEKFNEKMYWPIRVNRQETQSNVQKDTQVTSVAGRGFTKGTKPNANNSVMIGSIFDTFSTHASEMATYAAWLAPMEDINRIRNYTFKSAGETVDTVKGIIDMVHGKAGTAYLSKLLADLSNGVKGTHGETAYMSALVGNYKAASVGANLRVIIQQPTSILRALDMIDPQYLVAGMRPENGWKKALKYAPIAQWKDWGYFDINTGRQMKDVLFDSDSKLNKVKNWSMAPAGWADSLSWGMLWNAVETETKHKRKDLQAGTEAFYEAVAERFAEVVDRTQVVDGILQRSQIMRSADGLTKMATSFMGEPTKQYNMLMNAAYDAANGGKSGKKHFARAAVTLVIAGVVNAMAQAVMDAVRDDDKEEKYGAKWLEAFRDNLANTANPAGYIPFVKDVVSLIQGYDVSRMDMESIEKVLSAGQNMTKALNGEGKYTIGAAMANLFAEVARMLGVPVANLKREVKSFAMLAAIESDNYVMQYRMEKASLAMNYSGNKSVYLDILFNAYQNDKEAYEIIYADLLKEDKLKTESKSTAEVISDAMEDRMKDAKGVKSVDDLDQRYLSPAQQKEYSATLSSMKSNRVWKNASAAQRDDVEGMLYDLTVKNAAGEKLQEKIDGGARYGLDETEYLLYKLALDMCDQPNENGKLGSYTNDEVEAAIRMLGLSAKESAYLWDAQGKSEKSNPWRK